MQRSRLVRETDIKIKGSFSHVRTLLKELLEEKNKDKAKTE